MPAYEHSAPFIRPVLPHDLLVNPIIPSPWVKSYIFIASPFHIAGDHLVGDLNVKALSERIKLSRIALDIVGIEGDNPPTLPE